MSKVTFGAVNFNQEQPSRCSISIERVSIMSKFLANNILLRALLGVLAISQLNMQGDEGGGAATTAEVKPPETDQQTAEDGAAGGPEKHPADSLLEEGHALGSEIAEANPMGHIKFREWLDKVEAHLKQLF